MLFHILREFPSYLKKAWLLALAIYALGGALNLLVIYSNGGKMPTPTTVAGYYLISPTWLHAKLEWEPDRRMLAGLTQTHAPMTPQTRFGVLANRFYVITPINIYPFLSENLPPAISSFVIIRFIRSNSPVLGQEMHASIGDFIVWIGTFMIWVLGMWTLLFVCTHRESC